MTTPPPPESAGKRRRLLLRASTRRDIETGLPVSLELAAALQSELAALFVAEDAMLAASALPFPALVGFSGGTLTPDPARFEAALRREAESCRQLLAQAAERARLAWSFESLRGEAGRVLREASSLEDILVIGLDQLATPLDETIAKARELAPRRGGVLLVRQGPLRRQGPLIVVERPGVTADDLKRLAETLADALGARVAHLKEEAVGSSAELEAARLLLAPIESPMLEDTAALRRLRTRLRAPLLLLRTAEER